MTRYDSLRYEIGARWPRHRVVRRSDSSWPWKILWKVLGRFVPGYSVNYATTIGATTFVPDGFDWWPDERKWKMLRHEGVHVEQAYSWPLGGWAGRLNAPLFSIAYLLLLPALFTLRAMFEREAYLETLVAEAELGTLDEEVAVAHLVKIFAGRSYAWMWTRGATERWVRRSCADVRAGRVASRWRS